MTKTLPRLTELTAGQARRHGGGYARRPPGAKKVRLMILKDFKRYKNIVGDGRIDNYSAFPAV